ncbi:MAG: Coenzyme F420 hydrogenase/dehydrogenase, beta subunit C-terminal domain [Candidatus Hodarchaeales archaeon]
MTIDSNVFQALEKNIIDAGLCKACGVCVLACEFNYLSLGEGNIPIYVGEQSCANCGMCLYICPSISKSTKNSGDLANPLFYKAKSKDEEFSSSGQVAGVTNTIAYAALIKGIKAVRSLKQGEDITDIKSFNAYSKNQLLEASGAKHFLAPISVDIDDPNKQEIESHLFIGLPCVLSALNTLQKYKYHKLNDIIKIKLGLFCRGILDPEKFKKYIQEKSIKLNDIQRISYLKDKENRIQLVLKVKGFSEKIFVEEKTWKTLIWNGCEYCHDFLADSSDLSVGWEEAGKGWQSIAIFNKNGKELLDFAINKDLLEVELLDKKSAENLIGIHKLKDEKAKFI